MLTFNTLIQNINNEHDCFTVLSSNSIDGARTGVYYCCYLICFRWDEELINMAQSWIPKENSKVNISYMYILKLFLMKCPKSWNVYRLINTITSVS